MQARWGVLGNRNSTATGMYLDLMERKADLALCTVRPDVALHARFDHTIQYMQVICLCIFLHIYYNFFLLFIQDELRWIVRRSAANPQWQRIIQIFSESLWLLSFGILAIMLAVVYAIGRMPPNNAHPEQPQRLDEIIMQVASMMIGISTSFKKRTKRQRIVIFFWAMFCLNYTTAYTSGLVSFLTTPMHMEQVSRAIFNPKKFKNSTKHRTDSKCWRYNFVGLSNWYVKLNVQFLSGIG